jgi:hypothetical protein
MKHKICVVLEGATAFHLHFLLYFLGIRLRDSAHHGLPPAFEYPHGVNRLPTSGCRRVCYNLGS